MVLNGAVGLTACKKEKAARIDLEPAFLYCDDTINVNVPNLFTPTGDGINDVFYPFVYNGTITYFEITTSGGGSVMETDVFNPVWDGRTGLPEDQRRFSGRYFYHLIAELDNGTTINVTRSFYMVLDHERPCFSTDVVPVFGDQFDPRLCGISYATNDLVCVQ